jgi:hypothetical protein
MPSVAKSYPTKIKSPVNFENFNYNQCLEEVIQQPAINNQSAFDKIKKFNPSCY